MIRRILFSGISILTVALVAAFGWGAWFIVVQTQRDNRVRATVAEGDEIVALVVSHAAQTGSLPMRIQDVAGAASVMARHSPVGGQWEYERKGVKSFRLMLVAPEEDGPRFSYEYDDGGGSWYVDTQ